MSVMMYWVEGISIKNDHLEGSLHMLYADAERERFSLASEFPDNDYWVESGLISENLL